MNALAANLNAICDAQPYVTTWSCKDLTSGATAHRAGVLQLPAGSTRKTSIMMAALRAAHEGRLDLDEPVVLEERLKDEVVSGTFLRMTPGLRLPLRDALVQMIIMSDNVCTRMVMERISLAEVNALCSAAGMSGTVHRTVVPPRDLPADHPPEAVTVTTAADQVRLYGLILQGSSDAAAAERLGCSPAACRYALDILSWQKLRTKIPSLLPADTRIAHKGGTTRRGRSDAGIVYRDGQPLFILAVYTDQVPTQMPDGLPGHASACATIGRLARACWDAIGR
jgi:beta-lactamase class A